MEILNSLALLLVSKPEERAAVSALVEPSHTLKLVWAKVADTGTNVVVEEVTDHRNYLDFIILEIATDERPKDTLRRPIPTRERKIQYFASALVQSFRPVEAKTNLWNWDKRLCEHQAIRERLVKSGFIDADSCIIPALDGFIRALADFENYNEEWILDILLFAGVLSESRDIWELVQWKRLGALKELGRYYRAVNLISRGIKTFRDRRLRILIERVSCLYCWWRAI